MRNYTMAMPISSSQIRIVGPLEKTIWLKYEPVGSERVKTAFAKNGFKTFYVFTRFCLYVI